MTDKIADLKPCPFCGGEAHVSYYETESLWSHDQVTYTKVSCDECDISLQSEPGYETEAIQAWNTRALDAKDKQIDELEAALTGAAYIACLQRDENSERAWFIVGWQGGQHSMPNNEEQAWLYRRGMDARIALEPREPTEADKWCLHFTASRLLNKEDRNG